MRPEDAFGPLQVFAQGLLGFLNIKNMGINPEWLINSVQPTIDLQEWWFNTQAVDLGSGATVVLPDNSTGFNAFTTPQVAVPPGEFWYITDCSIRTSALAATDAASFSVGYIIPPLNLTFQVGDRTSASGAAGVAAQGIASAHRFWLPPSAVLAVANETNESAASITYTLTIRGVRLRV